MGEMNIGSYIPGNQLLSIKKDIGIYFKHLKLVNTMEIFIKNKQIRNTAGDW